jgi:hypothetical protein
MSRAFVREDADEYEPPTNFGLPPRSDPSFESAVALVLLEAARDGRTRSAEEATGYRWGDPHLFAHVRRHLAKAEAQPDEEQDRRFIRLARRFLAGS